MVKKLEEEFETFIEQVECPYRQELDVQQTTKRWEGFLNVLKGRLIPVPSRREIGARWYV